VGADFGVNASGAPAFVFQPVSGAVNATLKVTNIGSSPLFAGSLAALSTPGAFPVAILPGRELYVNPVTQATYLSAGYKAGTTSSTLTSNATAGSTVINVAATTGFAAGTLLLVGSAASSQEVAVVVGTTATAVTVSSASLFDHISGVTVSTATAISGQARCVTGVI